VELHPALPATATQGLDAREPQANPEIIFISSWNDWQYGNQIEPAVEYGCKYLDLTAEILGRWRETRPYRQANAPRPVTGSAKPNGEEGNSTG